MAQRKGNLYRQCLGKSNDIPPSTWRRRLRKRRISEEQLKEMGMQPGQRHRQRQPAEPHTDANARQPANQSSDDNYPNALNEERPLEANISAVDEVQDGSLLDPEVNYWSLSSSESDSEVYGDESDLDEAASNANQPADLSSDEDNVSMVDDVLDGSLPEPAVNYRSLSSSENDVEGCSNKVDLGEAAQEAELLASVLESSNIGVDKSSNIGVDKSSNIDVDKSSNIDVDELNDALVPTLQVSKFETLLMILHLAMRHGCTDVFLEDMVYFVNELVGVKDALPQTKFLFNKLFAFTSQPVIHFFCPECNVYLGKSKDFERDVMCSKCSVSKSVSSLNGGNYFLSLSMRNQIKDILSRPHIKLVSREQSVDKTITDVVDGLRYQSLMEDGDQLMNPNALSITFNSDGSPIYKSGPNSLWPIQFIINEIIPEQRFAAENVLVAGLWFSKSKPSMEIFLKPFVEELLDLQTDGVVWKKSDGSMCESCIFAICGCIDSVSKPQLLKHTQFYGLYGCGYCLHKNSSVTVVEEVDRRSFCVTNEDGVEDWEERVLKYKNLLRYTVGEQVSLRTDRQLREHMRKAEDTGELTYGAKGVSMLCSLKYFNTVYGFSVDYMHAILLGVTKRLASLWFDSTSSGKEYYIGRMIDFVDERLAVISPPSNMREVRPISDRVHWKAKDWRGFLLYFGLPGLINILPLEFFSHFQKLVSAIYILSKDRMTYDEVDGANRLLRKFVEDFQSLYGEENMVYNVHLCSHIARSVAQLGPLWANSAFQFESGNGRLVKLAKGTKGVATQIARKYLMMFSVPKLMGYEYVARDSVINYCSKVFGYSYLKNSSLCDGVELLGLESDHKLTNEQIKAFRNRNILLVVPTHVRIFNRAVKKGTTYTGRLTSRQVKYDDSCVRLTTTEFARIELIMKLETEGAENVWCFCRMINISINPSSHLSSHIKQCSLEPFGSIRLIPFENVNEKCVLISCGEKKYVAAIPNTFEKD